MGFPKRVCREASLWLVEVKKSSVIRFKFRSESNARELAAETRFKFRVSRVQLESCIHIERDKLETWNDYSPARKRTVFSFKLDA